MFRFTPVLMIALAIVVLPSLAMAQEAERPKRPGLDNLFKRLDADNDGQLTWGELPEPMKKRFAEPLKRADKNNDKKLSLEEFIDAIKHRRGGPPGAHKRPPGPRGPRMALRGPHHPREGSRMVFRGPHPGPQGVRPKMPNPKELFKRMDKNDDKQLSLEEFAEGMKRLHARRRPPKAGPRPPHARHGGPPHDMIVRRMTDRAKEMFKRGDKNKDGKVTLGEVSKERREMFKKILERVDKDGDKAISREEAKKAAQAMAKRVRIAMARRGKPGGPPQMMLGHRPHVPGPPRHHPPKGCGPVHPGDVVLRILDGNHDGSLSTYELVGGGARLLRLDRDHDGTITKREMMAVHHRVMARKGHRRPGPPPDKAAARRRVRDALIARFKAADKNNDGKLSREEAPKRLKKRFSRIDGDGDGQLTPKELKEAWAAKKKEAKKRAEAKKPKPPKPPKPKKPKAKK